MKLARPDTFHPRIVLTGEPQDAAGDDGGLVAALRTRGLHARWLPWDDPETATADLVILRSARGHASRLDRFLSWTQAVPNLLNPPAVVAWNSDRRYRDDLAERGVPMLPATRYAVGDDIRLARGDHYFVGASGTGTRRFSDRSAAQRYIAECHQAGQDVWVQSAQTAPETVLVFLGGKPSHAFVTTGDALHQGDADFEQWDAGAAPLTAAPGELLYARVHLVGKRVLELELIDPSLGWLRLDVQTRGLAQRQFALAVESALERLGLGPLSHRRP
ncbi:hypothetical protein [Mycobacterium vicinigordonae]|uniref:ATP-grasp domain-containing protein n=1 Tax=Mycobacterium vicinigordonae TaxID=1719132 RepID=A0A7D6HTH0_9MYCO|nr:hypothetical protein [Mycobacterium vicinigordonae]QLL09571.1 hypothetical protein H0P51_12265 [Mycobacterium vicinigordonae]